MTNRHRRRRRGFLLPGVLLTLLLVAVLAAATQLGAWRSTRAARMAWNGERAAQAADAAIAVAITTWDPETIAAQPLGARWIRAIPDSPGLHTVVHIVRVSPLTFVLEARSASRWFGTPLTATRRVRNIVALDIPQFPLRGAAGSLDALELLDGASVDGRDIEAATDGCAQQRDTLSVAGAYAEHVVVQPGAQATGSVGVLAPGPSPLLHADRAAFATAWDVAMRRTLRWHVGGVPAAPAWSSMRIVPADSTTPVLIPTGASVRHVGALFIDGDLVVDGQLEVRGLLVVRGRIHANGTLNVTGAMLARGGNASSRLGAATAVRYAPCMVRRALAAVGRPSLLRYASWTTR